MITMNFSEKIPTIPNPVLPSFHADSMVSRDQPPRTAEELYREYLAKHPATNNNVANCVLKAG
jgi:hypothetical protein